MTATASAKPLQTQIKASNELSVEELQQLLIAKKGEEVPKLKDELNELLTRMKEVMARLKILGESVSLMGLTMIITDDEKDKVVLALKAKGKPTSKTELAQASEFVNEKGMPSSKFTEVLKALESENTIAIKKLGTKSMVSLV